MLADAHTSDVSPTVGQTVCVNRAIWHLEESESSESNYRNAVLQCYGTFDHAVIECIGVCACVSENNVCEYVYIYSYV